MKILIIQLARLGDIYQTWPVVRALSRQHPGAQIDMLTRKKFTEATKGLAELGQTWVLESRDIVSKMVDERPQLDEARALIDSFIGDIKAEEYDLVLNLSFSPLSSRIAYALRRDGCEIRGYTRQADDTLAIPDDASAYFYAQVGPGRYNRFHLTDIFAQVAGVDLRDEDWRKPDGISEPTAGIPGAIVVHIGASENKKVFAPEKWFEVVQGLLQKTDNPIVLVGAVSEQSIGHAIADVSVRRSHRDMPRTPVNLVGETTLTDLFEIIGQARMVIGCDSAPMHMAALTDTPCLNLSFDAVNFWETGPRSSGSRILLAPTSDALSAEKVIDEAIGLLAHAPAGSDMVMVPTIKTEAYQLRDHRGVSPAWEMVQAVYIGGSFPVPGDDIFLEGVRQLQATNNLAIEQIAHIRRDPTNEVAVSILDRCDDVFSAVDRIVPVLGVVIRWFQTERVRIGPSAQADLLNATEAIHFRLRDVLDLYSFAEVEETANDDINVG